MIPALTEPVILRVHANVRLTMEGRRMFQMRLCLCHKIHKMKNLQCCY